MSKIQNESIKIIDCTIRDGGLVNNFQFEDNLVKNVFDTCKEANIDYMEIGYMASEEYFSYNDFGKWKFCKEDDLRRILGEDKGNLKLSVMADIGRSSIDTAILKENSLIDMVRVAAYIDQVDEGLEMIDKLTDKGYETTLNLMAVSKVGEEDLTKALEAIAKSKTDALFLVDSFGSLYVDDIRKLTNKYLKYLKSEGKEIGIHAHNNRQMAYANSIEALTNGATFVDATMAGLGRGAGNLPMELLLGHFPAGKYNLRPIIKCVQDYILPLKDKINWGDDLSYMLTGQFDTHPRTAISFLKEEDFEGKYLEFFDEINK